MHTTTDSFHGRNTRSITVAIATIFLFQAFALRAQPCRSDTPTITTDFCGNSVLTQLDGTSTEAAGSIIEVHVRTTVADASVSLGTTTVKPDGTWNLAGLSLSTGLLSATATADGESRSLPSSEIELVLPPVVTQGIISNPTVCGALDGTVELLGFLPFTTYEITYTDESGFQSLSLTADALGSITISGLGEGELQEIIASINGCASNTICSIELEEPTIPSFTLGVPVQPVICGGTGSILITGAPLQALDYEVSYYDGTTTVGPMTITSDILGVITIPNLPAGTYSNFQVSRNGCDADLILDRITLYDGLLPSTVVLGTVTQPTTCTALDGSIELTGLLPNTSYDVEYEDANGLTISTTLSTPLAGTTISLTGLGEGVYRNLRVKNLGCYSTPLSDINLASLPTISVGSFLSPLNCLSADGSIVLDGLVSGETYDIGFSIDGVSQPSVSALANASGQVELTGLASASYSNFFVTQGNCQSNILADIVSLDEIPIPEISLGTQTLPTACGLTNGSIELLGLIPGSTYDVQYNNSAGLQSTSILADGLGKLSISGLGSDQYSNISVSLNGCSSNSLVCAVDLDFLPSLSLGAVTPEVSCGSSDGTITLEGLDALTTYDVSYSDSNGLQTLIGLGSTASGSITLSGLSPDTYADLSVSLGGCSSESLADISVGSLLTISAGTVTNPTNCGGADGSIELAGLTGSTTYNVSYTNSAGVQSVSLTSDGSGILTIPGLGADNYSAISVNDGSCESNTLLNPITLVEAGVPSITLGAAVNPSGCGVADGSISLGGLLPAVLYDVTYSSSFGIQTASLTSDALGVLTIAGLAADDYQDISVSTGGCESNSLLNIVSLVDIGTPTLTLGTITNPTLCGAADGSIELTGLGISTSYGISYTNSLGAQTATISSDGSGNLIIPGLSADFYEHIKVSVGSCLSASVGPVNLLCDNEASYTVNNQTLASLSNNDILASATDPDGDIVCVTIVSGTLPAGVSIDAATGDIYVSAPGDLVVSQATVSVETTDINGNTTTQDVTVQILNTPPTVSDISKSVNEDETLSFVQTDFENAYSDNENNPITKIQILTLPPVAEGVVQLNGTNVVANQEVLVADFANLTFVPGADFNGNTSFDWNGHDGTEYATTEASVNITVNPVNDEPSFTPGANQEVNEDAGAQSVTAWATNLDKGAPDESGQTLTFTVTNDNNSLFSTQPAIDVNGNLTYTPADDVSGSATVSVVLSDDGGTANGGDDTFATQMFTITVNPVNDEPSFTPGANQVVNEDAGAQSVTAWATDLDEGAPDESGQTLTFTVTNDNNSLFSVQPAIDVNGNLTFTPADDASGSATVSIVLSDDGGTANGGDDTFATQMFTITVNPVNDEPSFTPGANQVVNEDAGAQSVTAWATNLDKGAPDESGQTLTFTVTNDNNSLFSTQPAIDVNGNLTFTLADDASGSATVSIVLSDDGGTANGGDDTFATQMFTITVNPVNDEPSFTPGANQVVNEDAGAQSVTAWATDLDEGAPDESGQTLTFTVTNDNNSLFSVQPAIDVNGNLTFTPADDVSGSATVSVVLSDDGGTANGGDDTFATQMFTITVNAVNDEPSFTPGANQVVNEDAGAQSVTAWATNLDKGAPDESGQTLTFTVTNDNNSLFSVQPAIDANGNLTYTLADDANGSATISIVLSDDGGTANGGDDTFDTQTFTITVNAVNDAPVAVADSYTYDEGSSNTENAASGVLANDTDADGNTLTAILATDVSNGILTLNADGSFEYTHDGSENLSDSFTYTVNDGNQDGNTVTVSITLISVNDLPIAVDDAVTVDEGATVSIDVASNDMDPDGTLDLSSIVIVSGPSNGTLTDNGDGTISYAHDAGESTSDSFTYTIDDNDGGTSNVATVNITIVPVNDPPVTFEDAITVNLGGTKTILDGGNTSVLDNDTDAENDILTAILVSDVSNGSLTLNPDGTFSYTHNGSATSTDSFDYKSNDGEDGNTVTVSIVINASNAPPVADDDAATVDEGATIAIDVSDGDVDPDGSLNLNSVTIISGPTNGTLSVTGGGMVQYTHDGSETISDSFTYTIEDDMGDVSNVATVSITVNSINDLPIAVDDAATMDEGVTVSIDVASNDMDPDGTLDLSSIVIISGPSNGTLIDNGDGTISYAHDAGETTSDSFTYTIDDNDGGTSNVATVNITIVPVNDPPVTFEDAITVNLGGTKTILDGGNTSVLDNDTDAENDILTAILVSDVSNGSLTLNPDGTFSYTHNGSATSTDSFDYKSNDGEDGNTVTVSIVINASNAPPVADDDAATVDEGATIAIDVSDGDVDPDGSLNLNSVTIISGPTNGTVSVTGNGMVQYTHDGSETISDSFTYTIEDDMGAVSNVATVSITVNPINDPPIADNDSETTEFGESVSINILDGDIDVDGFLDPASVTIITQPTRGLAAVNSNGTVTYTHDGFMEGNDEFTYTVNDNDGATSNIATVTINVLGEEEDLIEVPDVFTPDGDGNNDVWFIPSIENYPNNTVRVFNRWGNKVYEVNGYNNTSRVWDSTSNSKLNWDGNQVPDGTYFYVIELQDEDQVISGFVVISR